MALTDKQKAFINEYLIDFNATRAAERAKYSGNDNTLAVTGYDLLRNPKIEEVIQKRLQEKAMSADEALMRLADQARGSMGDFITIDEQGRAFMDLTKAPMHIVKKLTITKTTKVTDDDEVLLNHRNVIELYDAQAALKLIGTHHKLFIERQEITGKDGGDIPIVIVQPGMLDDLK